MGICLGQPLAFLFLECVQLGLCRIVPGHIAVVTFSVLLLALRALGIFLDAPLGQFRHHCNLSEQLFQFRVNGGTVGKVILHNAAVRQQSVFVIQQLIERRQKPSLDVLLLQMGRLAFPLPSELLVALPNGAAVFAVGGTVKAAAVAADDAGGENAAAAVAVTRPLPPRKLGLHLVKLLRINDGLVALLDVILRNLALVDLYFLIQEVDGEFLLVAEAGFELATFEI